MTFEQFFSPLAPVLKSISVSSGLNNFDSQDVIQEVALSLWKKWKAGQIDETQNVAGYASKLMKWRVKDLYRKLVDDANKFSLVNEDNDLDQIPLTSKNYNENTKDKIEILYFAIENVRKNMKKHRDYEIFADHFLLGKDVSETAKKFNLDNSTIYMVRCRVAKKVVEEAKTLIDKKF